MTTRPTTARPTLSPPRAGGPRTAAALVRGTDVEPIAWQRALDVLRTTDHHWLTTTRRTGGAPRTRPVLAVVVGEAVFTASSPAAHKALVLAGDSRCSLAGSDAGLDVVIEASATRVDDAAQLVEVAAGYQERYGWTVDFDARLPGPLGGVS